jgi:integrase
MAKPNLRLVTPGTEIRTVGPRRPPNAELRTREHLTSDEVDRLIEAAKANRHGHRDALMVLLAYRHGLRAAEVVDLRWGTGRLQNGHPARPSGQERYAGHAPVERT